MRKIIVNERIRFPEVRVVDENGQQLGVLPTPKAQDLAREREYDLILVAPDANPPVCRIGDVGKYKYELSKKEKEARKGSRTASIKEIKLSVKIAQHDLDVRIRKTIEFLQKKHKIKVSLLFRGREMAHIDLGLKVIERLIEAVAEYGIPESTPKKLGRSMIVVLSPK